MLLCAEPVHVFFYDFFSVTISANYKRISPFGRPTTIDLSVCRCCTSVASVQNLGHRYLLMINMTGQQTMEKKPTPVFPVGSQPNPITNARGTNSMLIVHSAPVVLKLITLDLRGVSVHLAARYHGDASDRPVRKECLDSSLAGPG